MMALRRNVGVSVRAFLLLLVCVLCSVTLLSCDTKQRNSTESLTAEVGKPAPDFRLQDLEGRNVSLSEFRGQVVLIEFWATWCPPCRESVPELIELQNSFRDKKFVVLGVSLDDEDDLKEKLTEFSKEYMINYPLLLGGDEVARDYNVRSIPTSVLVDREGKIAGYYMGYREHFVAEISERLAKL